MDKKTWQATLSLQIFRKVRTLSKILLYYMIKKPNIYFILHVVVKC